MSLAPGTNMFCFLCLLRWKLQQLSALKCDKAKRFVAEYDSQNDWRLMVASSWGSLAIKHLKQLAANWMQNAARCIWFMLPDIYIYMLHAPQHIFERTKANYIKLLLFVRTPCSSIDTNATFVHFDRRWWSSNCNTKSTKPSKERGKLIKSCSKPVTLGTFTPTNNYCGPPFF